MKRKGLLSMVLILFMGSIVFSQSYVFKMQEKGSKNWGYANVEDKTTIEPKFKLCSNLCEEGFATALYKGKYCIINIKGEIISAEVKKVKPNINSWTGMPQAFFDGFLITTESGKFGCLNTKGEIAIPIQYDKLTHFDEGYALAKKGKNIYVLDKEGKETLVEAEKIMSIKHFSEGLGIIEVKGEKWGYVDGNGKIAIEPQFTGVGYFNAGLAWAKKGITTIGFINKKGEWVIEPQFDAAKDFDEESGLAMVKKKGKWGYVNTSGKILYFDETEKTYIFSNGLAIGKKNGKIGFINNEGQWAIEPKFNGARPFHNGYAAAEIKNLWGMIDKTGNWVVQPKYENIRDVVEVK